jgi:hypothetical protein
VKYYSEKIVISIICNLDSSISKELAKSMLSIYESKEENESEDN